MVTASGTTDAADGGETLYQLCPDNLLDELNGDADYRKVTALLKRYRAQKR